VKRGKLCLEQGQIGGRFSPRGWNWRTARVLGLIARAIEQSMV
jgi:hypothetical protein